MLCSFFVMGGMSILLDFSGHGAIYTHSLRNDPVRDQQNLNYNPGEKEVEKQWKIYTKAVASRSTFEVEVQWSDQW